MKNRSELAAHILDVLLLNVRSNGQSQRLVTDLGRKWELSGLIPILAAVIVQSWDRVGIIDAGTYASGIEASHDVVAPSPQFTLQNDAQAIVAASCISMQGVQNTSILAEQRGQRVLQR